MLLDKSNTFGKDFRIDLLKNTHKTNGSKASGVERTIHFGDQGDMKIWIMSKLIRVVQQKT